MSGRKRKVEGEEEMSASPSSSPSMAPRTISQAPIPRHTKRMRTNLHGRPLDLPRLLETLSPQDLRNLVRSICDRHPEIGAEVVSTAPKPTVASTLEVLSNYHKALDKSFPYGNDSRSEYAYNRVRQPLLELVDAIKDFTPHFLPPNETQIPNMFTYLDGATEAVHSIPEFSHYQHNRHKQEMYEEMAKAWMLVIRDIARQGGGIRLLQLDGWDRTLLRHNEKSGGRFQEVLNELRAHVGWMAGNAGCSQGEESIRDQLRNGTFGP
ncbi:Tethering factor for nuclear proteasome sts1 [Coniosporium tulheliwenetii]|nr:Tethering factor for nuclear proteasome sts1 [Cladosporium sp. JES 115]